MSDWSTIENDVVDALAGMTSEGSPVFATVRGVTPTSPRSLISALGRERMPAAYVSLTGRIGSDKSTGLPGAASMNVTLMTRSFRSESEPRQGLDGEGGMWSVAERVGRLLHGRLVEGTWQSELQSERGLDGPSGAFAWEHSYRVYRPATTSHPTFGGVDLAGALSRVEVHLGPIDRAVSAFAFPGIDGVFERDLGDRGRTITWEGELRADGDAALNLTEAAIEAEIGAGLARTMTDGWSRHFMQCVAKRFVRDGNRRHDALTGEAVQPFTLTFTQLCTN